jgi:hypothetical protein
MVTRFLRHYVDYRRVGLGRLAAWRLAWMVALAGRIVIRQP